MAVYSLCLVFLGVFEAWQSVQPRVPPGPLRSHLPTFFGGKRIHLLRVHGWITDNPSVNQNANAPRQVLKTP